MSRVLVVVGCALLVARPALIGAGAPVVAVTTLFVALLALALLAPVPDAAAASTHRILLLVLVVGLGAFALGRLVGGGRAPVDLSVRLVALNTLAAIAEEAFFRRLVYGLLAPVGAAFAIGGAAVLFALVHLTTYGAWVLPIDVAAGVLFGWQRWASGSWRLPAATHALANVLVVL